MWTALALTAVLAPAQDLELKNVRTTYGILGQERKDDKFLPGDVLVVAFDIDGLKVQENGKILYAMGMELTKKGGAKPEFKKDPQDLEAFNSLGGTSLPAFALTSLGTDTKEGTYTLKVTIKDRQAKTEKTLTKEFEVVKPDFGFVRVHFSGGAEPAPAVAVPGQRLLVNYALVGFGLGRDKQPDVTIEVTVVDDAGKPTVAKGLKSEIKKAPADGSTLMMFYPTPLELNRPGKFTVTLKATDNISKKTSEAKLSLTVVDPAK